MSYKSEVELLSNYDTHTKSKLIFIVIYQSADS